MGQLPGCLLQKQRAFRRISQNTPAPRLFHNGSVVVSRIKTKQRQFEPVLTAGLAMAATGVAAQFAK